MMTDKKLHWENVYKDKSSIDVSWYQKEPLLSLELIHESKPANDEGIIDIGGGASVLIDHLHREGFTKLAVLDISSNALLSSQKRLGTSADDIEWFESDITLFKSPHQFSIWHDRAVFHFLTNQSDREKYVEVLKQTLCPGGYIIIAAFAIGGPEKCSGLDIEQYDEKKLMKVLGNDFRLLAAKDEVHTTPAEIEQMFMYFHIKYTPIN